MKQYVIYITYIVAILIFGFLAKTHRSQGLGDVTAAVWLILAVICAVGLVVSIVLRSKGFVKVATISLATGIVIGSFIVIGIILTNKYNHSKNIAAHQAKIKEQKEFYSGLRVLDNFSAQVNKNGLDSITSVTATITLSNHKLLNEWDIKLIAFVEPDPNQRLLHYKLFESDYIPVKTSGEQHVEALLTTGKYQINGLISKKGENVKLEYILLFVNSKDRYAQSGLNEGFAYTSLSKEDVEELGSGILTTLSPKSYALYQNRLMKPETNLMVTDLALAY